MSISDPINNGDDTQGQGEATIKVQEVTVAEGERGDSPSTLDKAAPQSPEHSSLAEVKMSSKKLCGVCNENEGKYKCSRCYLP